MNISELYIQVAYPIIMKQNWRGGAEARGGGMEENFAIWSTNEKLALFKRMLNAKVIKHYKIK